MSDRICPECQYGEGVHVSRDVIKTIPYLIYCCINPKCLNLWRISLLPEEDPDGKV